MGRKQLVVDEILLGLTPSTYQLVLKETHTSRKLPIIIGSFEAQSIALAIENKVLKRPNTHDLFIHLCQNFQIIIREIVINRLEEGVFFSSIFFEGTAGIVEVDSRTSDAIAIALRYDAPIFADTKILEEAGFIPEVETYFDKPGRSESEFIEPKPKTFNEELESMNLEDLEKLLADCLAEEDYVKAALVRDEISRR